MPHGDFDALVFLYETLKGHRWTKQHNWITGEPLSKWDGIIVNNCGRIQKLDLGDSRLDGVLEDNDRWHSFAHMETLVLQSNFLRGPIPRSIAFLGRLQVLNLSWNRLSGPIPDELYHHCITLRVLRLDSNKLTGIISPAIANLKNLELLNLSHNLLVGRIPVCIIDHMKLEDQPTQELINYDLSEGMLHPEDPSAAGEIQREVERLYDDDYLLQHGRMGLDEASSSLPVPVPTRGAEEVEGDWTEVEEHKGEGSGMVGAYSRAASPVKGSRCNSDNTNSSSIRSRAIADCVCDTYSDEEKEKEEEDNDSSGSYSESGSDSEYDSSDEEEEDVAAYGEQHDAFMTNNVPVDRLFLHTAGNSPSHQRQVSQREFEPSPFAPTASYHHSQYANILTYLRVVDLKYNKFSC